MKKTIFTIAIVAFITLIGSQAFACYWDGYGGGQMGGQMCGFYGDTNVGGNYQGFYDDTSKLRQDLAARQGEYNALMAKQNPDPKRASQLNREITTLHDQLRAQARSHNLPAPSAGYHGRMGGYGCRW
jgi:zinc resistance-associated protein